MSNATIPLRVIAEVSGHQDLSQLHAYLEVQPEQVKGAIASLNSLSYIGKLAFRDVPASSDTPLTPENITQES
jgi:integrase/recombinase XerD